ncbi:MAG: protein kinase, partial [Kofleriaceae bacterium]
LIDRSLGKFTILERLGRGGSGEVFRAEQVQLGRSAVIKVLRRDVVNAPNRVDRFLREAKLASRLDHPYAAHIYAFGAEPDGLLWIAMEHVRGSTLDALVARRGPMPPALFGPLFARLCEVVHTAHELGIVHRDIKGSNVMVIERAGQLLPKLLDFGIAKGLDGLESPAAPGNSHELTGQGSTLGSPHYMAPEQWRSAADVDSRADVYALGVLAYFCVSGGLPFRDVERAGLAQAHMETPPPPLRSIPLAIADVITRALAKRPDDRWASALSFGDAIRRAVGGIAPEAVPILDPATRDAWFRGGPQPIADAVARLARAATTVEADAALRELVAITCRWLGVLALSQLDPEGVYPDVRDHARALVGRDDGGPWIRLARVATNAVAEPLPGLVAALAGSPALELLADRLDDRERTRTAAGLTIDVSSLADALRPLEALLAYQLVVGRPSGAESWQGVRRRDRERVIVWGEPLPDGEVALLDGTGRKVATLSPLVQIIAPLPASEPELFLLWRTARGQARLVAAPWGFERDDAAAAQRLAILITEDADTLHDHAGDRSPYPGLAAYGLGDADRFVGREREIEALANRLVRSPLLAVLGPSGAGKSSFVHAGVLPRLAEHYEIVTMRPGRHPLHALAALPGVGTEAVDTAEIVQRLRLLGERAPRGLVVVIDQFEELVTLCTSAGERRRFAAVLAAAADGPSAPVRVVVTLRDDFATVLESEDAIRGRFDVFVLATPTPEALRRIVIEPARRAAVAVDARVVDDMVAEVAGRPASLPLLSFTAAQLWAARDRQARRITHDAYLELGGVAGALSTYADQVYGSLARRDQQIVRDLFSRLVASDGTRIPAPRSELEGMAGAQAVLAHLVDARLVVVREDEGVDIIEVVHECLAERWPRLARWRNEDAADRVLLGDVGAAARRWHDANRRADLLWRGEALAELRKLAARSNALTELERAFTDAAAGAEQRARRVRRILVGGAMAALAAIAIAMAYLGIAATRSRSEAETSAAAARDAAKLADDHLTKSLIAQGRRELNDGRAMAALAYFAEVMRRGGISPSVRFMVSIASRAWRYELEVRRTSDITELEVGGTWVVAGDGKGVLHWWTSDGKPSGDSQTGLDLITVLRRQPGDQLVAIGRRGVAVIDPKTRAVIHRIETKTQALLAHLGPAAGEIATIEGDGIHVYDLAGTPRRHLAMTARQAANEPRFSPTGSHVIVSGQEHAEVIDLVTLALRPIAKNLDGPLEGAADGSVVGYVDSDGLAHLLTATGTPIRTFRPANRPHTLIFSPTGDRVGALSDNGLVVHDANGKPLHGIPAVKSAFTQIEIRGDDVWLAPPDGTVQRYRRGVLIASLPSQLGEFAAFLVTKDLVLTAGNDGAFVMLRGDAEQLKLVPRPCETQSNSLAGVAVGYRCDETWHLFVGTREVASVADTAMGYLAYEPSSGRAAIGSKGAELVVYEAGKPIARASREHPGAFAFEDRDHVVAARTDDGAVSRWTIGADRWDRVATVPHASAVGRAGATLFVGTDTAMIGLRDGVESSRVATTAAVFALAATRDGRWVAAQLQNGATAIFDGATGALVRQLEPSDATGGGATFDLDGDLVIRPGRGSIQIYDRASGDPLIWSLDLLAESIAARFDDQGRIEVNTWEVGLLDIPIDRRPVADLIHDIDCKVPLRVVDARLGPAIPVCP